MKNANIQAVVLISFLLFAAPLCAQEKGDVLVMKNGDRFTCEVKGLEANTLYVKLKYVDGTISVQWSQVARFESSRLFIVKTRNGSVYTGQLFTADSPGDLQVKFQIAETPDKKVLIDKPQIVEMEQTAKTFRQRFNGEISFGLIYSKGNQSTQFNLGSSVEYPRDRWTAYAVLNSTLSTSSGANSSTRNQLDLGLRRLLRRENYFYAGIASFLQSSEQGISEQTALGGGIGRYFMNTNNSKISVLGGLVSLRTKFNDSSASQEVQNVAAAIIRAEVKIVKLEKTNLKITANLLPSISDPGRYYFNTNESYYIKLFSDLSLNFSIYGNYDNRPPRGVSGSDFGSSTGLTWTFGNK